MLSYISTFFIRFVWIRKLGQIQSVFQNALKVEINYLSESLSKKNKKKATSIRIPNPLDYYWLLFIIDFHPFFLADLGSSGLFSHIATDSQWDSDLGLASIEHSPFCFYPLLPLFGVLCNAER